MANKNPKKTSSGTNIQDVKKRNKQAAQGQSGQQAAQGQPGQQNQYGTEFASETSAEEVKKQNQKSQQNKK